MDSDLARSKRELHLDVTPKESSEHRGSSNNPSTALTKARLKL